MGIFLLAAASALNTCMGVGPISAQQLHGLGCYTKRKFPSDALQFKKHMYKNDHASDFGIEKLSPYHDIFNRMLHNELAEIHNHKKTTTLLLATSNKIKNTN